MKMKKTYAAALAAAMVLTAGLSAQAEDLTVNTSGNASITWEGFRPTGIEVTTSGTVTGAEVAASLEGQDVNLHDVTASSIQTSNGAQLGGGANITGGATVTAKEGDETALTVNGGADVNGDANVTGNATVEGQVNAGSMTVAEGATVEGGFRASNTDGDASVNVNADGASLDANTTYVHVTDGAATMTSGWNQIQVTEENGTQVDGGLTVNDGATVEGGFRASNTDGDASVNVNADGASLDANTTYVHVTDGAATMTSGWNQIQVTEENGTQVDGGLTVNDGATVNGGLTTDTAHVTENATIDGTLTAGNGTLTVSDGSIIGLTNQSGIIVNDSMASLISNGNRLTVDNEGTTFADVDGNATVIKGDTITTGTVNAENGSFTGDVHVGGDVYVGDRTQGVGESLAAHDTAIAENADKIAQNTTAIANNYSRINALDRKVSDLGGEIDNVGAISSALAGLHPLDYDGTGSKFQLAAAMGSYDGTQAAAIGGFYHFNEDIMMSVGGATSFGGDNKSAFNVGLSFRVGQGSSGKRVSNDEVLAQLTAMNDKIAALEAENQQLSEKVAALEGSESAEAAEAE